MSYRIEKNSEAQSDGLTLIRRSDTGRRFTLRILGTFFVGLGVIGLLSVWWRLDFIQSVDGALLPILFGLSLCIFSLGGHFLCMNLHGLPERLHFSEKRQMLLIGSKEPHTPVFKIPYSYIFSFTLAKNIIRSHVGQTSHKRIRYRVLLVLKNLAAWTLSERLAWPKEKDAQEESLNFSRALNAQITQKKSASELDILDVNECPMRFFTNETTKSWEVSWRNSVSLRCVWALGMPLGLLLGLFFTWTDTELNRVLLASIIIPVVLWALFLVSRIVQATRTDCSIQIAEGGFKAHFKGSAWPWRMNISRDWIGSFRFEPPEFGSQSKLLIVPRQRQASDAQHYAELKDEHVAMRTQYRASRARPLREKWVKTIEIPGLGFGELMYLAALLNQRLEESRSESTFE